MTVRVALVHADRPRSGEGRMIGWWSYPVPEFEWEHFPTENGEINLNVLAERGFDVVFWEDHRCTPTFKGNGIPVVYQVGDSAATSKQLKARQREAKKADLILVKRDSLSRFRRIGRTRRAADCVNDRLFRDRGYRRQTDVSYHCHGTTPWRRKIGADLKRFCEVRGYVYEGGKRGRDAYAESFARSKISVNDVVIVRNQRFFDVMASGACLLSTPPLDVSGESYEHGVHYVEWQSLDVLRLIIDGLLESGRWADIAYAGAKLVDQEHTWAVRARQTREILKQELGV